MRVALLSHSARAGDAIGNQVAAKLAFFRERGAEVRVFVESTQALHPAVRSHGQVTGPEGACFLAGCDLVVAEYGHFYPLLNHLPLLAEGRPRILVDFHGVTPPELWGPHNREVLVQGVAQRGLVWCADGVLVHSQYTWQELRTQCRYPAGRLFRLGFPVDLDFWSPGPGPGKLRRTLGLEGATLLLFVGRLAPNKRVPLLVEALGRLRQRRPEVHALVVGDTSDLYQAQANLCRQRAAALGVADRLHFLGHRTGAALRAAYRAAEVLVMPSLWESFCIPVIEAMACGVPVVASHTAALPETVGPAGLTFTPEDADDLARQLDRLLGCTSSSSSTERAGLACTALWEQLRQRGLERAQTFAAPVWREAFGKAVEQVLARPPRPCRHRVEVRRRSATRIVRPGTGMLLIAARVRNRGSAAALAEGPGRTVLRWRVVNTQGQEGAVPVAEAPLPGLLMPGQSRATALAVAVPSAPGVYRVDLWAEQVGPRKVHQGEPGLLMTSVRLVVADKGAAEAGDLAAAHRGQCLPDDYLDVSEGLFARLKRAIKRKLLGNFKQGYLDVLSRQQSTFNRQLVAVVQELTERCHALDRTVRRLKQAQARQKCKENQGGEVCP